MTDEHHRPPGTQHPRRFRPRFHWELLVCGLRGHRLIGVDAERLRPEDALYVYERDGLRWYRCLRCDSWLPLTPPEHPTRDTPPPHDEIELPLRPRMLRVVLENLVANAIRYAGQGSTCTVELAEADEGPVLTIADDGKGVEPADLPRLFDPFYRVSEARDRDSGGFGLGLAIAARAVALHPGEIRAENAEGGGLQVSIDLPSTP